MRHSNLHFPALPRQKSAAQGRWLELIIWEARLEPTLQRPKRGVHGLLDTRGRDCVASSLSGTVRIPLRCQTALI